MTAADTGAGRGLRALPGHERPGVASFPCAKKTGTLAMFSDAVQERVVMFCLYVLLFAAAGWMCVLDPKLGTAAVVGGWLVFLGITGCP